MNNAPAFFTKLRRCFVRIWKYSLVLAVSVLWIAGCSPAITSAPPGGAVEDNLSLFNKTLYTIFQHIETSLEQTSLEPGLPVYYQIPNEMTAAQGFVDNVFQEYVIQKDRIIHLVSEDFLLNKTGTLAQEQQGYIVVLQVQKLNVAYNTPNKQENVSKKKLSRNITVQLFCKIINIVDGKVVFAQTLNERIQDAVSEDDIDYIQNTGLSFAHAEPPRQKKLWDLLEAGTVLTAVGVIIFLLFSTRS